MKEHGILLDGSIKVGTFEIIAKTADTQKYQLFNLRILNQYFSLSKRKSKKLHVVTTLGNDEGPILKLQNDYKLCYIEAEEGCWVDDRHTIISKARLLQ